MFWMFWLWFESAYALNIWMGMEQFSPLKSGRQTHFSLFDSLKLVPLIKHLPWKKSSTNLEHLLKKSLRMIHMLSQPIYSFSYHTWDHKVAVIIYRSFHKLMVVLSPELCFGCEQRFHRLSDFQLKIRNKQVLELLFIHVWHMFKKGLVPVEANTMRWRWSIEMMLKHAVSLTTFQNGNCIRRR